MTLRRLIPLLWAALLLSSCQPGRGVLYVLFHSVGEGSPADPHDVTPEEFERHLKALDTWGATTVTLAQVMEAEAGRFTLPKRPVVITFDDGRACQLSAAMPALLAHKRVAETFVVSDWLPEEESQRRIEKDERGVHPYLTAPELRRLVASGAFVAESHSRSHTRLVELDAAGQREEIAASRERLRKQFGWEFDFFAYPFGSWNGLSRDLAEAAGYRAAMSVQKGLGSRYAIKRVSIHRGYPDAMENALRDQFGAP